MPSRRTVPPPRRRLCPRQSGRRPRPGPLGLGSSRLKEVCAVDWAGWAVFGLAATAALTSVLIAAQLAGWTRLDLPLLLGTLVVEDPDHARAVGFLLHLGAGQVFALLYALGFAVLGSATWWLGALFGFLHGGVALTAIIPLFAGVNPRIGSLRAGLESRA